MKYYIFLFFLFSAQLTLAQYTFKSNSKNIELFSIGNTQNISRVKQQYASKIYRTNLGDTLTVEPIIALTVKNKETIDNIIKQYNGKLSFSEKIGNVYYLACNASSSDEILSITSQLSQNKNVIECDAVHYSNFKKFNTLYPKQYYLHNINGVDINIENAWNIASNLGNNIIVTVIDEGVEHNHEDLPNILDGYTANYANENGNPINATTNSPKAHGTACAGIISAENNTIGIRGIASNAQILPINICPNDYFANDLEIAKAIRWASERADVLSCSWGGNGGSSVSISEALKDALTNGRNGKGCIIVFASGNGATLYNNLAYPASEKGVISVGAVDKTGKIWNYSQRGDGLSLVAPSGKTDLKGDIATTDRMGTLGYEKGNYTEHFGGTSAACPQVAGVAALMLAVNPNLTTTEVKNILEKTATDLGQTGYDTTYGYGLVNAYSAVCGVYPSNINGQASIQKKGTYSIPNLPSYATVTWNLPSQDTNAISISVTGEGNNECTIELNGEKTIRTTLTATISVNRTIVKTLKKDIGILGTFSGTYSVSATSNSAAITNRTFTSSSILEAFSEATVTGKSNDLYYYSATLSGKKVDNWQYKDGTFSFTVPKSTSAGYTYINLTPQFAGGKKISLKVYSIKTSYNLSLAHTGNTLHVKLIKESDNSSNNDLVSLQANEEQNTIWTIEVFNTNTGQKQAVVESHDGAYMFNTYNWIKGTYVIRVTNGINSISKKIAIR